MTVLNRSPRLVALLRAARSWYLLRRIFDFLAGYRRVFRSMTEANTVAAHYLEASHECPANVARQIGHGLAARPSDYPVLFHLERILPEASTLFDLGGNVGNLFYCYSKYISFPDQLVWTVHDLAPTLQLGRQFALERGEPRLRFTDDLAVFAEHQVLLVSGALHYLEPSLPDLLRTYSGRPAHVIVNRAVVTTVKSVVTVQDSRDSLFACKTVCRRELVAGMGELGYDLVDSWSIPELSLHIPFYPEYSVAEYTGLYFRMHA
jgi:putative methyltransferase (TIGR04325 family)